MSKPIAVAMLFLVVFASFPLVLADRGMIPITPGVSVYEPGQKAILAWNGQEEILILSTDVRSDRQTTVLEILPLPSRPTIEAASFTSFQKIQKMIWQEGINQMMYGSEQSVRGGSVEILFHTQIGAHNITVVEAADATSFLGFANSFLKDSGTSQNATLGNYQKVIEDYMSRGFKHYALDLVTFTPEEKSITPILYKFYSDTLYYPLLITSPMGGTGKITIFTLTKDKLENHSPLAMAYYQTQDAPWVPIRFTLSKGDLATIDLRLSRLLPEGAWLAVLNYDGNLGLLNQDLMISSLTIGQAASPQPNIVINFPIWIIIIFFLLGAGTALTGAGVALAISRFQNKKQK